MVLMMPGSGPRLGLGVSGLSPHHERVVRGSMADNLVKAGFVTSVNGSKVIGRLANPCTKSVIRRSARSICTSSILRCLVAR